MENQGPLILDISSDEETGFADVSKGGGGGELGDREDVDWLSKLLVEVGENGKDDSDDVVFVSELFPKPSKKSRFEAMKPAKVVDDDDDCVVLDSDPGKAVVVVNNKVADDDSDDLEIIGEKGEVACRDFPHPRHHCAKYPFASTPHDAHCSQCHCYVCDSLAPCSHWGNGKNSIDHCHASDKEEYWNSERKQKKKGDKPIRTKTVARIESYFQPIKAPRFAPPPIQPKPQNHRFNRATFRPCANPIVPNLRSQPSIYVDARFNNNNNNPQPQFPSIVNQRYNNNNSLSPRGVFKRSGLIGASRNHHRHSNRLPLPIKNGQYELPCIRASTYSSYQSQPIVSGNSLSQLTQPMGSIAEPYLEFPPENPHPVASSQPQNHISPTQNGIDDFGLFNHGDIPIQSSVAAAETSGIRDIRQIVERSSFDFESMDSWDFENQSFSGASPTPDWNAYSPETAFTDAGTLFDF